MIRIVEKQEFKEAEDQKLQNMIYNLFKYLTERDVPKEYQDPYRDKNYKKMYQKNHLEHLVVGIKAIVSSLADYSQGYARNFTDKTDASANRFKLVVDQLRKCGKDIVATYKN